MAKTPTDTDFSLELGYKSNVIGHVFSVPDGRTFQIVGFNYHDKDGKPLIVRDLVHNVNINMVANKQFIKL